MAQRITGSPTELTALLVAPNRELAEQFLRGNSETRAFQVLANLSDYPSQQTLDIRLRQLKPDVVLIDVASNLDIASTLVEFVASFRPVTQVVGLHHQNDSAAIVRTLRCGASEFLYSPFEAAEQREAIARIRRLRQPENFSQTDIGRVLVFASTKPGSGASTLATQTAYAIRRSTGDRVLLIDFDLCGGTIAFYLKLHHSSSITDALERADQIDPTTWASLVAHCEGIDVLPAPDEPDNSPTEPNRLHDVLEFARMLYGWVILDVPAVPHRTSLLTVSEADEAYLISTPELASLHLTRRSVNVLEQLGFTRERYRVLINRSSRRDGISSSDMEKVFNCPIHQTFPNDYFSLHRVISLGQALTSDSELGRTVESFAGRLITAKKEETRQSSGALEAKTA
jgi:pilus assembly protein CpaE